MSLKGGAHASHAAALPVSLRLSVCLLAAIGSFHCRPAVAADERSHAAAEDLVRSFNKCVTESDGARRLACYDKAMQRPDNTPTPEQRFGLTPGQVLQKQHLEAPPKDLTSQVVSVGRSSQGVRLTLANGQVWTAQSPSEPDLSIEVGDTVTVSRAVLGSFLLSTSRSGNRSMRVNRLK